MRTRCASRSAGSIVASRLVQRYGLPACVVALGDGIGLQILTVFPGFLLQQIRNSLAVRRVVPRGLDQT